MHATGDSPRCRGLIRHTLPLLRYVFGLQRLGGGPIAAISAGDDDEKDHLYPARVPAPPHWYSVRERYSHSDCLCSTLPMEPSHDIQRADEIKLRLCCSIHNHAWGTTLKMAFLSDFHTSKILGTFRRAIKQCIPFKVKTNCTWTIYQYVEPGTCDVLLGSHQLEYR